MDLEAYLANVHKILSKFESKLGWKSPIEYQSDLVTCSCDNGHRMPEKSLSTHMESCKWRKLGYNREEIRGIHEQEERTNIENNPTVINSDDIISQINPSAGLIRTEEHYKSLLNCDQRRTVYDAEVAKCYSSDKPVPDKALYADLEAKAADKLYQKENPDNLSEAELLQKMRDMKRRRQSYRAKNVHITKRSQTEIIRGVLAVHMEELTKLWNRGESSTKDIEEKVHESHPTTDQDSEKRINVSHPIHHEVPDYMDMPSSSTQSYFEGTERKRRFEKHSRSDCQRREERHRSYKTEQSNSRKRSPYTRDSNVSEDDKRHKKRKKKEKSSKHKYKRDRRSRSRDWSTVY